VEALRAQDQRLLHDLDRLAATLPGAGREPAG
jgi:hypothetical protein